MQNKSEQKYRIERTKTNISLVGNDFVLQRLLQGF